MDAPVYGGITANATGYAGVDEAYGFANLAGTPTDSNFRGFGLDLSEDLGVSSLIGVEFVGGGNTDPNFVLAVIPEPTTGFPGLLGGLALIRRKRARVSPRFPAFSRVFLNFPKFSKNPVGPPACGVFLCLETEVWRHTSRRTDTPADSLLFLSRTVSQRAARWLAKGAPLSQTHA